MKVPFADLAAQHREVRGESDAVFNDVVENSSFVGGRYVEGFEREFADYCGAGFSVTCGSGTDAVRLALMGSGVGRGEEVITVSHTFVATVEAVLAVGAHPVLLDIDPRTYNLSVEQLGRFLEESCRVEEGGRLVNRTSGRTVTTVLPVHLYGLPAEMEPLMELTERFGLKLVEDAAQAHGASCAFGGGRKKAGTFGLAGAFSFYPGKNLGALGEGGAVVTDDPEMAHNMRVWRDHGQSEKYIYVSDQGWNLRLDSLQCGLLGVKLKRLDRWNDLRRRAAGWYREFLEADERVALPHEPEGFHHIYHVFGVRLARRDQVREKLLEKGVETGLHYPIALHRQEAFRYLGYRKGDLPVSESVADTILSLPMFPHITREQVSYVSGQLRSTLDELEK